MRLACGHSALHVVHSSSIVTAAAATQLMIYFSDIPKILTAYCSRHVLTFLLSRFTNNCQVVFFIINLM
jgi:hypothetical protein